MTKKLLKNNLKFQTKSLAFKIIFSILSIAIITAIIIVANSRLSTPAGSAFESFPTHCRYEWVDQSGTKSADGKAHEVYANAGDTIPMYLTIRNRNIDPLALVMYGIPPQGTLLPEIAPHRGGHEFRIGVKDDEILSWIDPSSFYPNPDGDDNRFAVYDGPDANVGDELILTWNLKIKDDADGIYNLYTGIVREFDNWPWQVDVYGSVIPGGSDIFWKFVISPGEEEPDLETELDRVEIIDSDGVALNSFAIDEEDNKQFYVKAYGTDGKDITSNTDFTWSINSQYNPVDVGYITQTGLYTAGTTAEFYLGAIRLMGSYNNKTDSDAISVTIGEVPPFGGDPELDRVEILDSSGSPLPSFSIDQNTDKQLYAKAYSTTNEDITSETDFTWSIDSKYSSVDVGAITDPGGLYTSGTTAGFYSGALRLVGSYNQKDVLDTVSVTINEAIVPPSGIRHTMIIESPGNYNDADILGFAEQGIDIINWTTVVGGRMTPYRDLNGIYSLSQDQKDLIYNLYSAGQRIMWLGISYGHIDDIFPLYGWDPATEVAAATKAFTTYFEETNLTDAKVGIYTGVSNVNGITKHGLYQDESISWLHYKYDGWVSSYNPEYIWSWHNQYGGAEYARSAVRTKSIANGTWSRVIWLDTGADTSIRRNTNFDDTDCHGGTFVKRDAEGTVCSYQLTDDSNSYWAHHTQLPDENGIEHEIPITEAQHLVYSGVSYMQDSAWQQKWWNAPACGTGCKSLAFSDITMTEGNVGDRCLTAFGKIIFGIN